ncbi:MAG: maleylacetate reductase [Ilumatobacteraceae bacterium]
MEPFVFTQLAARMVFGAGAIRQVGDECAALGVSRVMLVHDGAATLPADDIVAQLGSSMVLRWHEVAQHVPVTLAERARDAATAARIDAVVCVGGGSSTGLAKAIALSHRVPIIAVPTTYAGSEQTTIYGLTGGRHKQTGKDPAVLPRVVVYDPELTVGLPPHVTGPSAFNALAHSVEALWAPGCNPVTTGIALQGVRAIHGSLPTVMSHPADVDARGRLLVGAALSGMALGATAAGLHHKICHVLGGMFDLVHADAHSVVLPHVLAFNAPALPVEMAGLAAALDVPFGDEAAALWDLAVASHVPTRLADLAGSGGPLQRNDLRAVADAAVAEVATNPRPVDPAELLGVLERAFDGQRPNASASGRSAS